MKNGVAYKNQNIYLKINIYLKQASTLSFRPVLPLYRNQSTDLWSILMDGLYIMATLDWNKVILTTTFSKYYFFLSWRNPLSPSVKATLFPQIYVLLNANQIIELLYLSWFAERKYFTFSTENNSLIFRRDLWPHTYTTFLNDNLGCNSH